MLSLAGLALWGQVAFGATVLKDVSVTGPGRIEVVFDQPVSRPQIQVETLRDIVQVNLKDVSVYPAKIVPVSGQNALKKIFAYQYTPSLVRFRMTVSGDARAFEGKVKVQPQGKTLILELPGTVTAAATPSQDKVITQAAAAVQSLVKEARKEPVKDTSTETSKEAAKLNPNETALLREVTSARPATSAAIVAPPVSGQKSTAMASSKAKRGSIGGTVLAFFAVLFAGVVFVFVLKKFRRNVRFQWKGLLGKLPGSGILGRGKMIEVVATHFLGPKKSIAVVRVKGRLLLVGISSDSINLITELGDEDEIEDGIDAAMIQGSLPQTGTGAVNAAAVTEKAALKTQIHAAMAEPPPARNVSFREQIRKRVEGMKAL